MPPRPPTRAQARAIARHADDAAGHAWLLSLLTGAACLASVALLALH